jgi:hypothetical protein
LHGFVAKPYSRVLSVPIEIICTHGHLKPEYFFSVSRRGEGVQGSVEVQRVGGAVQKPFFGLQAKRLKMVRDLNDF